MIDADASSPADARLLGELKLGEGRGLLGGLRSQGSVPFPERGPGDGGGRRGGGGVEVGGRRWLD